MKRKGPEKRKLLPVGGVFGIELGVGEVFTASLALLMTGWIKIKELDGGQLHLVLALQLTVDMGWFGDKPRR